MAEETQKNVVIKVSTDTSQAQGNLDDLTKKLDEAGKIDIDKPFKKLKEEIKQAQIIAEQANIKFGETSEEFRIAADNLARLKAQFGDFQGSINAFNPENKLQAVVSIASGAVTAVQGVAGALTLVGVNSETANEAVAKLQGLLALGNALEGIDNIVDGYGNLVNVIKGSTAAKIADNVGTRVAIGLQRLFKVEVIATGAAFNTLKTAIISTGIGALIVGIGLAISALSEWADSTDEQAEADKRLEEQERKLAESIDLANKSLDIRINLQRRTTLLAEKQAQADGKSASQIAGITRAGIVARAKILEDELSTLTTSDERFFKVLEEFRKTNEELEIFDLDQKIARTNQRKQVQQKSNSDTKALNDAAIAEQKRTKQELDRLELPSDRERELFDLKVEFDERRKTLQKGITDKKKLQEAEAELDRLFRLEQKAINKKFDDEATQARRNFLKRLNELDEEIRIGAIQDERAREREEIVAKYREQFEQEANQLNLNFLGRITLLVKYKQLEKQELDKFDRETNAITLQNELNVLDQQIKNNNTTLEGKRLLYQQQLDLAKQFYEQGKIDLQQYNDAVNGIAEEQAAVELEIEQRKFDARQQILGNTADVLGALSELSAEASVEQKALAIAQTLINTYTAIAATLASQAKLGPVAAIAQAIATGVFGLLQVKKIVETKIPGKGDGGGENASKVNQSIGNAPVIQASATAPLTIQDVRVTNQGQQPVRAFITNSDLQTNEERNRFLNGLSTF